MTRVRAWLARLWGDATGPDHLDQPCPRCAGDGAPKSISKACFLGECVTCDGTGRVPLTPEEPRPWPLDPYPDHPDHTEGSIPVTVPITHHAVVETDEPHLTRLAKLRPVTDEDRADAFAWRVECSDPARCEGWQECGEDHPDAPDDPFETGGDEQITLHGVEHTWNTLYGWVLRMEGCPVEANAGTWCDPPEGMPLDRPGRYLIDAEWDDTDLYLVLVDAEAGDPA